MAAAADNLLSKRDLCDLLGVAPATLERWLRQDIMPPADVIKKRAQGGRKQRFWRSKYLKQLLTIKKDFETLTSAQLATKHAKWWVIEVT